MSGMSILAAVTLLGGSAFAAFSNAANANANTFSTGNADLQISEDGTNFFDSINNPFNGTNIAPGYSHGFQFYLRNVSSASIPLTLSTTFTNVNATGGLDNELTAQITCGSEVGGTWSIASMNGGNVNLGSLGPDEVVPCTATFALPLSSTASDSNVSFDAVFNGNQ